MHNHIHKVNIIKYNIYKDYAFDACLCLGTKEINIYETWCLWITKHLQDLLLLRLLLATTDLYVMHMR
jgi:hypothetical protein